MKVKQKKKKKKVLEVMGNFMGKLKSQLLRSLPPKSKSHVQFYTNMTPASNTSIRQQV